MGMGYAGAGADVVETKTIEKFAKKEYQAFIDIVNEEDIDIDEFAQAADYGDLDQKVNGERVYSEKVVKSYKKLQDAFKKKTGLDPYIAFHNSDDNGDRYDEVSGVYWAVDGVYQLTPAGKKMKNYVEHKSFVQFG